MWLHHKYCSVTCFYVLLTILLWMSLKKEKSSLQHPRAGLVLSARTWRSPVKHKQLHRTPASDQATLRTRRSKTETWQPALTPELRHNMNSVQDTTKITRHSLFLTGRTDCCFFVSCPFKFFLLCLPSRKDLLRYTFMDFFTAYQHATHSKALCLKPSPTLPDTRPNPHKSFLMPPLTKTPPHSPQGGSPFLQWRTISICSATSVSLEGITWGKFDVNMHVCIQLC